MRIPVELCEVDRRTDMRIRKERESNDPILDLRFVLQCEFCCAHPAQHSLVCRGREEYVEEHMPIQCHVFKFTAGEC